MKLTPGPWVADRVGDTGGENPETICEVCTEDGYIRVCEHLTEADALLIAEAPLMLTLLKAAHDALSKLPDVPFGLRSRIGACLSRVGGLQ